MGAAIYIDVIAIFLWKCMVRILQLIRSSGWERKLAVVKNVSSSSAATPGCPVVEVTYDVTGVGEQYQDSSEIPFLFIGSAQEYARAVPFQSAIRVRVDPRNLERSLYFDKDQNLPFRCATQSQAVVETSARETESCRLAGAEEDTPS